MSSRGFNNFRSRRGRGFSNRFRGSNRPYARGPSKSYNFGTNESSRFESKPVKGLTEKDIGVTEYVSEHKGFNGIIKSRFSDFQVSEINEKGEIAQLTDLKAPVPPADEEVVEDEDLLLNKYNLELLPMETWDKLNKLTLENDSNAEAVEVDVTGMSKEERTKIHDAVKKAFGDSIVGSTVTRDDKKYCTFDKYRKGVRVDNRVKWVWPGEYLHFVVYKENCDTMEAASRIVKRLRMNLKTAVIGYAGTKDRRAKTTQWFSLRKVDPRKVVSSCEGLPDIKVGNFSFSDEHLKLGMLKGNRFQICLRNVTVSDAVIDECCTQLRDNGFINYYGLQRFGSRMSAPTSMIGLYLLKNDYEQAIKCILEPRPGPLHDALSEFRARGPPAALAVLPHRHCTPETRLLTALAADARNLPQALDKIPRNTRLLYLHSYQSLVWNKMASIRLKMGREPLPGDLVPVDNIQEETVEIEEENLIDEETEDRQKNEKNQPKKMPQVKILTQKDIDSERYSISDIVLPLPGHSVEYPPNMKQHYEEVLAQDGLKLDMKNKNKTYSVGGGYRRVCVRPSNVQWRCVRYSEPHQDLILSDLDKLRNKTIKEQEDGKYKALLIDMTLPTSCYATMALRELLRVDTSTETQAQQNNYYKNDENVKNDENDKNDEKRDREEDGAEKRKIEDNDNEDVKKVKLCDSD